ncbi:MAG: GTP-binding protein [Promethearchaeota archaeon]|nr:MAG: GTP-binding protein [Candidatus Lokiarchaeota archaeon]
MEFKLKIIIIGEPAVGKTSLVKKFVSGQFANDYRASIGTNIFTKKIKLNSGIDVKIHIWDIAGQERWIAMRSIYYKGTDGVLMVADLTRKNTFEQIEKFWYPDLKKNNISSPIILLMNKSDLIREITEEEIEALGKKIKAKDILITSAKTDVNVEKAFKLISEQVLRD